MNYQTLAQRRAKQTLNSISFNEQHYDWQTFHDLSKHQVQKSRFKRFPEFSKDKEIKKYKIHSTKSSGKQLKLMLIPNKVILQQNTPIKNELKNKSFLEYRKKNSFKNAFNNSIQSQQNQENQQSIDYMKFWIHRRFKRNSINHLVTKIQQRRQSVKLLRQ